MTIPFRASFSVLGITFCLVGLSAAGNGSATWPLVAVAAFSSAVMLETLLRRNLPVPQRTRAAAREVSS